MPRQMIYSVSDMPVPGGRIIAGGSVWDLISTILRGLKPIIKPFAGPILDSGVQLGNNFFGDKGLLGQLGQSGLSIGREAIRKKYGVGVQGGRSMDNELITALRL